jgi:hypothetical protein
LKGKLWRRTFNLRFNSNYISRPLRSRVKNKIKKSQLVLTKPRLMNCNNRRASLIPNFSIAYHEPKPKSLTKATRTSYCRESSLFFWQSCF